MMFSKLISACRLAAIIPAFLLCSAGPGLSAGIATTIPSSLENEPAALWSAIMEQFYGPYDKRLKCWVGSIHGESGTKRVCMRPHKLASVNTGDSRQHHIAMGGYELNDNNGRDDCHACSGTAGFLVLQSGGPTLELVAKSDLAMAMGSWGTVPLEEFFELRRIGDGPLYGWVIAHGYMGQGYTYLHSTIHAMVGDRIRELGLIPTGFSDMGNCDNGTNYLSDTPCSDYSSTLDFVDSETGRFHDIRLSFNGYRLGKSRSDVFNITFDPDKMHYAVPEELTSD